MGFPSLSVVELAGEEDPCSEVLLKNMDQGDGTQYATSQWTPPPAIIQEHKHYPSSEDAEQ